MNHPADPAGSPAHLPAQPDSVAVFTRAVAKRLRAARDASAARAKRVRYLCEETVRLWRTGHATGPVQPSPGDVSTPIQTDPFDEPDWKPLDEWRAVVRRNFVLVGSFSVVVNLLMLTVPIYLFQLSDRVLTSRSIDTLLMLTLLAVVFLGALSLVDIFRRQMLGSLATRMETLLGGPLLAAAISAPHAADGEAIRTMRSLHQVRNFISSPVMLLLFDAPLAPLYFAAVFLISVELGVVALVAGAILVTIALLNQKATSDTLAQAGVHATRADARVEALSRNAQVINAMGMLHESILHWGREHARALSSQNGALDANFWISGTSKFFRLLTQIAVLGWGAFLALQGEITGGMMIAASIIASRALQPLEGMIEGWRSVVQTRAAYARVISAIEAFQNEKARLRLPRPEGRLVADRLLYIPPGRKEPVLNGVSFALEAGESLAIVGPSGSGKSTLARMLVGCLLPTAGNVRLDGTELRNWDRRLFGTYTGYLPQEVELFPGTIRENVCRMRSDLSDEKVHEAALIAGVHDMISRLPDGYETVLEGSGAPLSGGQKQRIGLARALFGDPAMIVLDEPNSNLDAEGEKALAETLARAKQRRVTVVVITQRPMLLNSVDRVLVLRAGRVEGLGPPSEVLYRVVGKPAAPPKPKDAPGASQRRNAEAQDERS
ncbi:type I secretion system permease/ATPase [Hyphomicrobium sp.]|uniref:type I secretion system permease/ATPase n=1 Tax=Hyphomicrobium sp. TaxID=82 RepID=UPI002C60C80B|nr:type I secretion system permease/ATPase [Hyphomicrobium sp.]HRN87281.1 type I secretion system permease/ATPase [Hyphomicrobium sp.]HRQ25961.1 type I secretion system permease/ATPase [Hyphomicrobium sp.]